MYLILTFLNVFFNYDQHKISLYELINLTKDQMCVDILTKGVTTFEIPAKFSWSTPKKKPPTITAQHIRDLNEVFSLFRSETFFGSLERLLSIKGWDKLLSNLNPSISAAAYKIFYSKLFFVFLRKEFVRELTIYVRWVTFKTSEMTICKNML